jgi:hypothetical protein
VGKKKQGGTKVQAPAVPVKESQNWVLNADGKQVTVGVLTKLLATIDPSMVVSVSIGPHYDDIPLTDVVSWPKHGAIFLIGEPPDVEDDEDDEDDTPEPLEAEWVELPREEVEKMCDMAKEREPVDEDAAEPA